MQYQIKTMVVTAIAVLFTPVALAHGGIQHGAGFADGFMHPATGLDHMLLTLLAGTWAARNDDHGVRDLMILIGLFAAGLLLGGAAMLLGQSQMIGQIMIVTIAIIAGISLASTRCLPYALFGGILSYHGAMHIVGMPAGAFVPGYVLGLVLATFLILVLGLIVRQVVVTRRPTTHQT